MRYFQAQFIITAAIIASFDNEDIVTDDDDIIRVGKDWLTKWTPEVGDYIRQEGSQYAVITAAEIASGYIPTRTSPSDAAQNTQDAGAQYDSGPVPDLPGDRTFPIGSPQNPGSGGSGTGGGDTGNGGETPTDPECPAPQTNAEKLADVVADLDDDGMLNDSTNAEPFDDDDDMLVLDDDPEA